MTPLKDFYDPSSVADFLAKVGVDATTGLSRDDAMTRRALYGANRVTPPVDCPSWVCCLLPCLLRTTSMVAYHAALPREATVKRLQGNGTSRKLRMDAASLVYGDLIEVKAGEIVGADVRVIECSDDCVVDQTTLVGDLHDEDQEEDALEGGDLMRTPRRLKTVSVAPTDKTSALVSSNVLLMATQLVKGTAVGVVIATGDETVWGQLLENHAWPVKGSSKRMQYGASHDQESDALVNKAS